MGIRSRARRWMAVLFVSIFAARSGRTDIILDFTTGGGAFGRPASTYGWSFRISAPLNVAALGLWNEGRVALAHSHPVALWDSQCRLLVQATVDNSSIPVASTSQDGRWLFTNIAPMTLPPGTYILGAYYPDAIDKFRESLTPTTVTAVVDVDRREAAVTTSLMCPTSNILIPTGYFGPNLSTAPVSAAPPPPVIAQGGILNGASFVNGQAVAPGSLVSIFGTNLASSMAQAGTIPLSTSLGGVTVRFINGATAINAPITFVTGPGASSQINAQVPWNLVPTNSTQTVSAVVMVNGSASSPAAVTVGPFSPGIFTTGPPDFRAIAQNLDGTLAQPAGSIRGLTTHAVRAGEALIIYATGLGAVDNPPADGAIPPSGVLANTLTRPQVLVGGVSAEVLFSGLTPQFVGVNQVNIIVPSVSPGDRVPLQIQMGGITSPNNVIIAVDP